MNANAMSLHQSQLQALAYVRSSAMANQESAREIAAQLVKAAGTSMHQYDSALCAIQEHAPIDVCFHPDRMSEQGVTVAADLLATGRYKNQFETGISNGGLTAFEGGSRDIWEKRLFGGAYQKAGVSAAERPKYGALNLMGFWNGASPRFGSCFFRLKPEVAQRCSFAYGDSSTNPVETVVAEQFAIILTRFLTDDIYTHAPSERKEIALIDFLSYLASRGFSSRHDLSSLSVNRSLDEYIEVHIHGALDLACDVQWLAADPSFCATECGNQLIELSQRHGFPIRWNPRHEISTDQVPGDFRGPVMIPLAARIAPDGILNAARIGQAVVSLRQNPENWLEWGSFGETLQYLKQIWHVLVAYGHARHDG